MSLYYCHYCHYQSKFRVRDRKHIVHNAAAQPAISGSALLGIVVIIHHDRDYDVCRLTQPTVVLDSRTYMYSTCSYHNNTSCPTDTPLLSAYTGQQYMLIKQIALVCNLVFEHILQH